MGTASLTYDASCQATLGVPKKSQMSPRASEWIVSGGDRHQLGKVWRAISHSGKDYSLLDDVISAAQKSSGNGLVGFCSAHRRGRIMGRALRGAHVIMQRQSCRSLRSNVSIISCSIRHTMTSVSPKSPLSHTMAAFTPRTSFPFLSSLPRSYFLGHHHSGLEKMKTLINQIDLIIECRDYRVPLVSRNPLFEASLAGKERLIVYTKRDLGSNLGREDAQVRLLR